ncbi:uncharacterized protein LOC125678631 isoform X2 [Ostrea edulis]|nr:uncharacterized protein LOC125678631 isoform X2 [Ostrea edulis]XP_056013485.1 uncharacterized protein LOC125678631 isoform X2 [Ostrea edulis]
METLKKRREMVNKEGAELEEGVKTYIGGCQERQDLLVDVDHWLSSIDLTSDLPAEAHIDQVSRHFWEVHRHVMLALNRYESLSEKVMEFGSSLLTTTNAMIQEKKENARDMAEGAKKKINVINERQLLADQKKWDSAVKMVMSTFEEAMKWTKNAAHQNLFKRGQMQFRELSYGMKKRNAELKMKGKAEEDAKLKLQKARAEVEEKAKEFENVRKNFRKLNAELEDKKQLLTMTMENNTNLSQKCQKQGVQIKELQKVMATQSETIERGKSASHPPHLLQASPPGSSPSSPRSSSPPHSARQGMEETVTESSAHVKLDQTEKELEEKVSIATLRKMKSEIRSLEGLLSKEKEKVRQMSLDKGETKRNDQSRQGLGQEIQRLKSKDEDSTSYKTPREHAVERERVEGHLNTERLRNVELVKGLEDRSRQQVTALQEDVLNVLRAVMRFKDHVCTIVEGENLKDAAEALKALGPNIPDTMTPDPKEMFDLLVGSVVEFMQNMEVAIADAFLSMREMIKKSKESKDTKSGDVSRVEERNKKQMEDSKSEFKKIEFKLKIAKQRLIKFEQFKDKEKAQERKYFALLDRYRRIWKMYNNLNKDMAMLQEDLDDTVAEKLREKEQILISQIQMELKDKKRIDDKELEVSVEDQRNNIRMLKQAFKKNRISKQLYYMALPLLEKSADLPIRRLRFMMEKYIAFRSINKTRARTQRILNEEDLSQSTRHGMELYLERLDVKLTKTMNFWHAKINSLNQERKILFKFIWKMFGALYAESGLLLIHPLLKSSARDKAEGFGKLAAHVDRETLKNLCSKGHKRVSDLFRLPSVLEGVGVFSTMTDEQSSWDAQFCDGDNASNKAIRECPHLLNYDINREQIRAQRSLEFRSDKRNCGRPVHPPPGSRNHHLKKTREYITV